MKTLPELDFGSSIAFFLPGVVALYAVGDISPWVASWFVQVLDKDLTFGASVLIVLGGLLAGIIVSGFRAFLLDWIHLKTGVKPRALNYRVLANKETLEAYKEAINNTYRFYQFYGNTVLSLTFFLFARFVAASLPIRTHKIQFGVTVLLIVVLFIQSRRSLRSTYNILEKILAETTPMRPE